MSNLHPEDECPGWQGLLNSIINLNYQSKIILRGI